MISHGKEHAEHTPAPWKMTPWFSQEPRIRRLQPPPHYGTICTVTEQKQNGIWSGGPSEADARLIEAAPELLAMLKDAASFIGCSCDRPSVPPCGSCVITPKIEALIKRIEGNAT